MMRHLNLIPWKIRCRMLVRRRLRQWSVGWVVLALVAIVFYIKDWNRLSDAYQQLGTWQRRAVGIQLIDQQNTELRQQNAELRTRLAKYGHLKSEQIGYQLLAVTSRCSQVKNGAVLIQKLNFNQMRVPDTTVAPNPAPTPAAVPVKMREVKTLSLSGVATSNLAVAEFVSALRDTGAFESVDLKASQGADGISTAGSRTYQIVCSF